MNIKQYVSCLLLLTTLNSFALLPGQAYFYNATTKPIFVGGRTYTIRLAPNTQQDYKSRTIAPGEDKKFYFAITFTDNYDTTPPLEIAKTDLELKKFQEPTFVITEEPSTPSGLTAKLIEGKEQEKKKRGPGAPGGPAFPEEEKKRAAIVKDNTESVDDLYE